MTDFTLEESFEDAVNDQNYEKEPNEIKSYSKTFTKLFSFAEMVIFGLIHTIMQFFSNSTVKSLSVVAFDVISEIFVYIILGICCVFITLILQMGSKLIPSQIPNAPTRPDKKGDQ